MGQNVEQKDILGATALHAAVDGGNIEAAEWLLKKNTELANIRDNYGTLPVHVAAGLGKREMVDSLLKVTKNLSENESGLQLSHSLASSGLYDIALSFLRSNPKLASMEPSPLVVMAQKRSSFRSGTCLNFWQRLIYSGIPLKLEDIANHPNETNFENPAKWVVSALTYVMQKLNAHFWDVAGKLVPPIESVRKIKLIHHQALKLVKCLCEEVVKIDYPNAAEIFTEPLRNATCLGIHEIVEEILESFPSGIHLRSEKNQSLFHLAIVYRREKEVGKFILPQAREHMNADGKTPQEVFTETHKDLVKEGEKWMKDTATSCTIVAALITTVVFAAAITVPGGTNSDNGLPFFLEARTFTLFGISDALAMFSSSTSLLMFLSVLTSRYGERDFLYSLPRRLIIGLVTLFLSIISMMIAFGATLKIVLGEKRRGLLFPWLFYPVCPSPCLRCCNFRCSLL
ncbi:hypothetical protein Vadar_019404 [Vaccinium darrowii]|nr:hypothetical protein Vadar_019404 [Vaccinium darrowii]